MFSLRQLEAFVWTVRLKTLSRAAQRINLAQPTVSKRIQELEWACGFAVFEKKGRSVDLTPRGHALYQLAEKILKLTEEVAEIKGMADAPRHSVAIGVTELTAHTWLPAFLNDLAQRFPVVDPHVAVEQSSSLQRKLIAGELDLIVRPTFAPDATLVDLPLSVVEFSLMGSPRLCDPHRVYDGIELSQLPLLTHGPSTGSVVALRNWMRDIAAHPKKVTEVDSMTAQVGMAIAGMGVTLLPREVFGSLLSSGQLIALKTTIPVPPVEYRIGYRRHEEDSLIARLAQAIPDTCDFTKGNQG